MLVLLHSPALGPATWEPVAAELRQRGQEISVPSLLRASVREPPTWPSVVEEVRAGISGSGRAVVLVAHSNAGLFVPVLVDRLPHQVEGCVLVDAGLPPRSGSVPAAPPELVGMLTAMAVDGLLPPWTEWWQGTDVASLFPDAATRNAVTAEQPRLPMSYYGQRMPVPAGWDARPCGYLAFSTTYAAERAEAERRGWPVATMPGQHLHMLIDPGGVADAILNLLSRASRQRV